MLRWLWSRRLPSDSITGGLWWAWCSLSLVLVVASPSQLAGGVSFWTAPARSVGQALLGGLTFLALVALLAGSAKRPLAPRILSALLAAAICYGSAAWLLVRLRPDLAYSPPELVVSAVLGISLAFLPYFFGGLRRTLSFVSVAIVAAALGGVVLLGFRSTLTRGPIRTVVPTALKVMSVTVYSNLVGPIKVTSGGAIERYEKSFLVVTGDGEFYVLDWNGSGDALKSRRLPLSLPVDRATSESDEKFLAGQLMAAHKVTDMVVDDASVPANVFLAYQEWNAHKKCFTVRVAVAAIDEVPASEGTADDPWKLIFESWPCVPLSADFAWLESGGRLAWLGDKLLLTVGDFGLGHSVPAPSQSADSAYGKVLLLDRAGHYEIFTLGHRNPEGLLVDSGRIWLTEHGPQGGDELNLLARGRNYGWPLATYGTDYGQLVWPLAPGGHDHGAFTEPVFVFPPSTGISNLIRVSSPLFSEWKDDLLIGSLRARSLFRLRIRDDHAIYVETIPLGYRVRDLVQGTDGRILLWTQSGRVIALSGGPAEPVGSVVFERCGTCHEAPEDSPLRAPSLKGIVGSKVARESGYAYSRALLDLGGKWTEERLSAFLKDPNSYAPGSRMMAGQVPDANERRAVIGFLRSYR
jgi:cytochrome c2